MNYKGIIKCFSEKNVMAEQKNFRLLVDSIDYANTGRYFETDTEIKGDAHIYALVKGDCNKEICSFISKFSDELGDKESESIILNLKSVMVGALELIDENKRSEHSAALIFVYDNSVYAAGFGDMRVYCFSSESENTAKLFVDASHGDTDICASKLGNVTSSDKYIISLSSGIDEISGDELERFFSEDNNEALEVYDEVSEVDSNDQSVTASICFEKIRRKIARKLITVIASVVIIGVLICGLIYSGIISFNTDSDEIAGSDDDIILSDGDNNSSDNTDNKTGNNNSNPGSQDGGEKVIDNKSKIVKGPEIAILDKTLKRIAFEISGENSKIDYYVKNLSTGEVASSSENSAYSANLERLYIAAAVYSCFDIGSIEQTPDIDKLIKDMMTSEASDSAALLLDKIGGGNIEMALGMTQQAAQTAGCSGTTITSLPKKPADYCAEGDNLTSAKDISLFLEKLYKDEFINEQYCQEILNLMTKPSGKNKTRKYLPDDISIASISGEAQNVHNDSALIVTDKCDYIVSVMISNPTNTANESNEVIARISKAVYEYMNSFKRE